MAQGQQGKADPWLDLAFSREERNQETGTWSVQVRVVARKDGQALNDTALLLSVDDGNNPEVSINEQQDANGHFRTDNGGRRTLRVSGLSVGLHAFEVSDPASGRFRRVERRFTAPPDPKPARIAGRRVIPVKNDGSYTLWGFVLDSNGARVPGVQVALIDLTGSREVQRFPTSELGIFEIPGIKVPAGEQRCDVEVLIPGSGILPWQATLYSFPEEEGTSNTVDLTGGQ